MTPSTLCAIAHLAIKSCPSGSQPKPLPRRKRLSDRLADGLVSGNLEISFQSHSSSLFRSSLRTAHTQCITHQIHKSFQCRDKLVRPLMIGVTDSSIIKHRSQLVRHICRYRAAASHRTARALKKTRNYGGK